MLAHGLVDIDSCGNRGVLLQTAEFDGARARQIEDHLQVVGADADNGAADLRISRDAAAETPFAGDLSEQIDPPDRRQGRFATCALQAEVA